MSGERSSRPERAGELANLTPLAEIVRTDELWRRPNRLPDYERENRALLTLMQALADSPATILQTLAETVLQLVDAQSSGLSLLTKDGQDFYWAAIAGGWRPHLGGGTPRDFGPCGDVLDCNGPMLFTRWERRYAYLAEATPLAEEGLLVPFHVDGKAVGTIWAILHDERRRFDAEDLRRLRSLSRFASAAYQSVQLQHAEVLIKELNHRVKNTLAAVQSIAAHTLTPVDAEAKERFDGRLIALSRTHDLLARAAWEGAGLRELLQQELEPYRAAETASFAIDGPDLKLPPKAALALGMAFHELATNAAKYGAFATASGRVRVSWEVSSSAKGAALRLTWAETGGPLVKDNGHHGFGRQLIESGLPLELDGTVELAFATEGVVCSMELPIAAGV